MNFSSFSARVCVTVWLGVASLAAVPAGAQPIIAGGVSPDAERARIATERAAIEQRTTTERADCYQKFVVQSCLDESRDRRREAEDALRRQENVLNDAERKLRSARALQQLDAKAKDAAQESDREVQSREARRQREQRAAESEAARAEQAAKAPANAARYEQRQKNAAERRSADLKRGQSEVGLERERYERKLERAAERRTAIEQRNAERTKPRAAPLPDAPLPTTPGAN